MLRTPSLTEDCIYVSVVINTYNHGHFLCMAIDNTLRQTYPYLEVLIVAVLSLELIPESS